MNQSEIKKKAGVIAIIRKGDKFIMGLEIKDSPLKGKWRFLGGKLEPGETKEEALYREIRLFTKKELRHLDIEEVSKKALAKEIGL